MTPFGRQPVTAGLLATRALAETPAPQARADKWALLRDLTAARAIFGVSDRDLAVLSALISFHPQAELADGGALIVFPSNASLSARAHGMPESTLRRHLAALVRAGLILRRDSPNGKRYASRASTGDVRRAFGFDLRPMLVRATEIADAAMQARAHERELRHLRESVIIHLRDAAKLLAWARINLAGNWDEPSDALTLMQRRIRRKLNGDDLRALDTTAAKLAAGIAALVPAETEKMTGNDNQNERHQYNSYPDNHESESCADMAVPLAKALPKATPSIPFAMVLRTLTDLGDYAPDGIRNWQDFVDTAAVVAPMMGIAPPIWAEACHAMGPVNAAVTLACILQRIDRIANPGGYLRSLALQAQQQQFSPEPMVMALLRAENTRSA